MSCNNPRRRSEGKGPSMYRENKLKSKLAGGENCLGAWMMAGDATTAEVMALAGYDALVMDHEHGATMPAALVSHLQAIASTPCTSIVRVPDHGAGYLKRVLDAGVEGIMFPSVNSAEEASAAVAACRYPPKGFRGAAYGVARATGYGMSAEDYLATVDDRLFLICQIETLEGVEAIPDMAAVEGVDMLFVGPYDLSGNMGRLARFDDPEVRATVLKAERAVLDTGRWLGSIASLGRSAAEMAADGCRLVVGMTDVALLREAAKADIRAFREGRKGLAWS